LSKAANTYWDNRTVRPRRKTRTTKERKAERRVIPFWASFGIAVLLFGMIAVSINLRVFREMREEASENTKLASQIENLMDENLALQEEIHTLKTDPDAIARQAKRIGIDIKGEKVSVPAN
jgi:cell division protein FtsB